MPPIDLDYNDAAADWPKARTLDLPGETDDPDAIEAQLLRAGLTKEHALRLPLASSENLHRYPALARAIARLPSSRRRRR